MASNDDMDVDDNHLLAKMKSMIEVEKQLSLTMRKVEPWICSNAKDKLTNDSFSHRVRPIPPDMDAVNKVLAVARNLSNRTSAPAGWNSNAPVIGFTTPNPLPHQLRGGLLAGMQLDRARKTERDKKRQLEEEKAAEATARTAREKNQVKNQRPEKEQKRRDAHARPADSVVVAPPEVSMNLSSDSSSNEDSD